MNKHLQNLMELKLRQQTVDVNGITYIVREMKGEESERFESSLYEIQEDGSVKYRADKVKTMLVALTVCDEQGNRIFTGADEALVGQLPSHVLNTFYNTASAVNGIDAEAATKN